MEILLLYKFILLYFDNMFQHEFQTKSDKYLDNTPQLKKNSFKKYYSEDEMVFNQKYA